MAEKLKEFGFNELCHSYYDEKGKLCVDEKKKFRNKNLNAKSYTAPYYKNVLNWLENKYNISFEIKVDFYFSPHELAYFGHIFIPDDTSGSETYHTVKSTALDCINDMIRLTLQVLK